MINSKPLISICVPTFNGEAFLKEALNSIEKQLYRPIEVVISDDFSKDKTCKIAQDFAKNVGFPVNIVSHKPEGIGANWNNCIKCANGDYIKFLFQDDVLVEGCLDEMIKPFMRSSSFGMVVCDKVLLGDPGEQEKAIHEVMKDYLLKGKSSIEILSNNDFYKQPRNKIGEPTCVLLKKEVFSKVGFFNQQLTQSLDYEFWYRLLLKYEYYYIDKPLVGFRIHEKQTTKVNAVQIMKDTYLLPLLLLKKHYRVLSITSKKEIIKKIITGFIAYYFLKPIKSILK